MDRRPSPALTVVTGLLAVLLGAGLLWAGSGGADGSHASVGGGATTASAADPAAPSGTVPAAMGLDPGLVAAYERARSEAADAGHELVINSGFRTPERQRELLAEEVAKRGSYEEATRWVFPPERSMHVQGLAIDVGDRDAAAWLRAHGASVGLCHTLSWEWWHFEWRQRWQDAATCPDEATDPSEAPGR